MSLITDIVFDANYHPRQTAGLSCSTFFIDPVSCGHGLISPDFEESVEMSMTLNPVQIILDQAWECLHPGGEV